MDTGSIFVMNVRGKRMTRFEILGQPVAKGRARKGKSGFYTPEKTKNYETLVQESYMIAKDKRYYTGQLRMEIELYFQIPKKTNKETRQKMIQGMIRPTTKPDVDNCIKSIADALNGVAYEDDKQIIEVEAKKFYSETPRAEVTLISYEEV